MDTMIACLVAPFVGSFIGLVAIRLPVGEDIVGGRSHCRLCTRPLGVQDLIPVVSWLFLRGRCRRCDRPIDPFYPVIEIAALGVAIWSTMILSGWLVWVSCLLGWSLLCLSAIDARHFILPNILTLSLAAGGFIVAVLLDQTKVPDHLIGGAAGFMVFAALGWVYRHIRGHAGLGLGDAKLLAASGVWLSWIGLPSVILWASLSGLGWSLIAGFRNGDLSLRRRLAFGPHLCLGTWLVWLYGPMATPWVSA